MSDWVAPDLKPPTKAATSNRDPRQSYVRRRIDVTIQLGRGDFGEAGQDTITLRDYRVTVTVNKAAIDAPAVASIRVYGMKFSIMQRLLSFGNQFYALRNNRVMVQAGDETGMVVAFTGTMREATFDGGAQPDVALQIEAYAGLVEALRPAPPISLAGQVDVATVMKQLAGQMGVGFENHGVNVKLRDVYYPGTAFQQMRRIAEHAGIDATLDDTVLAINPRNAVREGDIPLITPVSGLKDYPLFNAQGIIVTGLFQVVKINALVAVQSSLWDNEKRFYKVYGFTYTLESERPNGPWFCTLYGQSPPELQQKPLGYNPS